MMADHSDNISDLLTYVKLMDTGKYEAILGSRFLSQSNWLSNTKINFK